MSIARIDASRASAVEDFFRHSRHLYRNIAREDLPTLLDNEIALLGEEQGKIWGFLCIQAEERPATLPATAANRATVRAAALAQGRSPSQDIPALIEAATTLLPTYAPAHRLTVYGNQDWLNRALHYAGFTVEEKVQFLALARLQRWQPTAQVRAQQARAARQHPTLQLRPCHAGDLATLAGLDAQVFSPLWHFGSNGLRELLFAGPVTVATIQSKLVGYSAVSHYDGSAQLSRLAVHPDWQGQGLGHLLLWHVLQTAQAAGLHNVLLNTQIDNQRAQQLYQAYDFYPTGEVVPILGRDVGSRAAQ